MISRVAGVCAVVFTGLFSGFLLGILVFELSLREFDGRIYAQTQQVTLVALPVLASVLLFPGIVASAVLTVLGARVRDRVFWSALAALLLLVVALVVTLSVNVPVNLAEAGWNIDALPADWAAIRDRWQLGHVVRTSAALAAFVVLVLGTGRRTARAGAPAETA